MNVVDTTSVTVSTSKRAARNQEFVRVLLRLKYPELAAALNQAVVQEVTGVVWTTESRTGRVAPEPVVYDFFLELRPPYASDLNPSAYLHARGATQEEAIASVKNVPATWSVYVKRTV